MKEVAGFYIDAKLKKEFEDYCIEKKLVKPLIIEMLIRGFLENAKKKS